MFGGSTRRQPGWRSAVRRGNADTSWPPAPGTGGSAELNRAAGTAGRPISGLHGHLGAFGCQSGSEAFRVLPGVQPGLPHEQRYLSFPQQLASERWICKFKWAQIPNPCSLDTALSLEFPQPSSARPARPSCLRPSHAAPADGRGGARRPPKEKLSGHSQGLRALRGLWPSVLVTASSCSSANGRALSATETPARLGPD